MTISFFALEPCCVAGPEQVQLSLLTEELHMFGAQPGGWAMLVCQRISAVGLPDILNVFARWSWAFLLSTFLKVCRTKYLAR